MVWETPTRKMIRRFLKQANYLQWLSNPLCFEVKTKMSVPKTSVKYGKYSSLKLRQEVCAILPQQGASGQA